MSIKFVISFVQQKMVRSPLRSENGSAGSSLILRKVIVMRILSVSAVLLYSIVGVVGGCVGVSEDTEDDASAKGEARQELKLTYTDKAGSQELPTLARDGGLNPIDAGPLKRARELEAMGLLHMTLQGSLGSGFSSTIKVLA